MMQKAFYLIWSLLGIILMFMALLVGGTAVVIQDTLGEIQNQLGNLQREDIIQALGILEQQVENDKLQYELYLKKYLEARSSNWTVEKD